MLPSPTLLIADDDADIRETLRGLFAAEPYRLVFAENGAEALARAADVLPDVILLDVLMPQVDGLEVCRRLRADARQSAVPILLITALDSPSARLAGLEAGADDFISKPFDRIELQARVRAILRLNRYRQLYEERARLEREREQAEALGRENEARFRSVLENSQEAAYRRNLQSDAYDFMSPVIERLTGWTVAEMTEADMTTILGRIHPDDQAVVRQEIERTLAECRAGGRATGVLEYRFRCKDGTYRWLADHLYVLPDAAGQPLYRGGTVRDVTDRKRAEAAWRDSALKLETLFACLPVGVSVLDAERQVVYVNHALENILGLSAEGLRRAEYRRRAYLRPDGTPMPLEEFASARALREQQAVHNVETGVVREDGRVIWTNVSAVPVVFSDWRVIVVTDDITARVSAEQARRQAETTLRASEANLTALIENTDGWIWSIDARYRLVIGNRLFHRNVSALLGRELAPEESVLEPFPPAARDEWQGYYDRALTGECFQIETWIPFSAAARYMEYRFTPITANGAPIGVTGFGRDITARKQTEDALRVYNERLRQATAQLTQVQEAERLAISKELHDQVGQSLTALSINLNLIRRKLGEEAPDVLRERFEAPLSLVEGITDKIRGVMAELHPPVLEDYGLAAALRWYAQRLNQQTGLEVAVQGEAAHPPLPPMVSISLFRIAQEALTNVLKHSGATSATLRVEVSPKEVVLSISDQGRGFQAERPAQAGPAHWGLVTMRERAELIGGRLTLESAPGQGTIVTVRAPR